VSVREGGDGEEGEQGEGEGGAEATDHVWGSLCEVVWRVMQIPCGDDSQKSKCRSRYLQVQKQVLTGQDDRFEGGLRP
jgi:hypothetical protein